MKLSDFDFELPAERIALRPAVPRDSARMLVVRPDREERFTDDCVSNLVRHLRAGDVLVVNDTKVIPAALSGTRARPGSLARISANLVERLDDRRWAAFARPMKRLAVGDVVTFGPAAGGLAAGVEAKTADGRVVFAFERAGADLEAALAEHGAMPLPPYIAGKRAADRSDDADYQTMFAARSGAVAAPTAGLHFTQRLLDDLAAGGVGRATLTLHVGAGTFLPVKSERVAEHRMHAEFGEIGSETAARLNAARAAGGRLVAVGTTSLRLLESAAREDGTIEPFRGETDIFIVPGYRFKGVDLLLTNFHLPKSTLFMLVCAFSGAQCMKAAYAHAIARDYRFYSYGDACLLHPDPQAR